MKILAANLALFLLLTVLLSGMAACTGAGAGVNVANSAANGGVTASGNKTAVYPKLAPGLADAELELLDGGKMKISDHAGKVLMLNIWGTWCGPCRGEVPHLVALKEQYGDRGFDVIGMNIGNNAGGPESIEDIKRFAEQMKINYTIVRTPGSATAQFYKITGQQVVPQGMLIDREGRVRGVFIGGGPQIVDSMKQTVEKVINE